MCAISKEEAQISKERLLAWAKSDKPLQGGTLGDWIFRRINSEPESSSINYIESITPNAAQQRYFLNDKPNEFPCTPKIIEANPLKTYYNNIKKGDVFFRNHNGEYVVVKREFSKDRKSIYVLTRAVPSIEDEVSLEDLPHSLNCVNYVNNLYIHSRETGFLSKEYLEEKFDDCTP
jgi:hypothetical protein